MSRGDVRERLRRAWPQARAALVAGHVLAVVLLGLPSGGVTSEAQWRSKNVKSDFAGWADALRAVGVDVSEDELAERTRRVAERYVRVRAAVASPFEIYPKVTGARQGWAMFASPQRHPAELHVDILEGKRWRPVFRSRSREHRWLATQLDHHRVRKLTGRFGRGFDRRVYDDLARYLSRRAFEDFADARRVRVRLYAWDALPPEEVRAGRAPRGKYIEGRTFRRPTASP